MIGREGCQHAEKIPIPDSLAEFCKACGQVWVDGEPWAYKSGNITEWLNDAYGGGKKA